MPRLRQPGAPEPKRRSRFGCHQCKGRKVKCDEHKPSCGNCEKYGETCDYSIRLQWDGRPSKKNPDSSSNKVTGKSTYFQSANPNISSGWYSYSTTTHTPSRPTTSYSAQTPSSSRKRSMSVNSVTPAAEGLFGAFPAYEVSLDDADADSSHHVKRRCSDGNLLVSTPIFTTSHSIQSPRPRYPYQPKAAPLPLHLEANQFAMVTPGTPDFAGCPASSPNTPHPAVFEGKPPAKWYGYDQGRGDLDVRMNDDANALRITNIQAQEDVKCLSITLSDDVTQPAFGFGMHPPAVVSSERQVTLQRSNYYAGPVAVWIPASLQPLPSKLKENHMNLLYFHHFLNHTARCLVPHDCPENAFRTILPQMAVRDENLLSLLLAYSANHRARLLKHDVPRLRIAYYVENIFATLIDAINTDAPISDSTLAAAIMLASLEIISPSALDIPVPWTKHLGLARDIIVKRGGYHTLRHGDKVSYFLSRWFAYLDVLGALSGGGYERPLTDNRCTGSCRTRSLSCDFDCRDEGTINHDDKIDCFLGFTGRCIAVLAEIANLAKDCDQKKRHLEATTGSSANWTPSEDVRRRADPLETYLRSVEPTTFRGCSHRMVQSNTTDIAVNSAFHHAGLIHLYRRVLGYKASAAIVQSEVRSVLQCMEMVDKRSLSCMIFPVFSAGCEALDRGDRAACWANIEKVEKLGMAQARRSKNVMGQVWSSGKTWWEIACDGGGPFVG